MSVIGWFATIDTKASDKEIIRRLGCGFLITGVLLLPLQVGQGSLFAAYHLQWADVFLGLSLAFGALTNRKHVSILAGLIRVKGSFMHPNALAHFLAVTGFLFIYYIPAGRRRWVLGGYALAMVCTISRSVMALPLWWLAIGKRRLTRWLSIGCIFLIMIAAVFFTYYAVGPEQDLIVSFRWKGLQAGFWTWRNNIWLGLGPGSWPIVPEYATVASPARPGDAMNAYVKMVSNLDQ